MKSNANPAKRDWKGMMALEEEFKLDRKIIITLGNTRRLMEDGVEIIPVPDFLEELWAGKVF